MSSAEDPGTHVRTDVGTKHARRRELLNARRALPAAAVATASRRAVANLRRLPELTSDAGSSSQRTLLLYAADPDEIDLTALLDAPPPGFRVLLPRVEGDELVTVPHEPGDALVVGELGVREPTGPAIDLAGIDVVVVPGVAFSPSGGRLGRGRGMYDRLLPRLPHALRIGVCIELLVVEDLPLESHDVGMDLVVTDASIRRRDASDPDAPA
jgi:5-formyltetrahydrofolate cyclo-ligase